MKNKFLFTVILTSLCLLIFIVKTFAQEEYKTESFKVSKGGSLKVEISGGDILVRTSNNNNEVKVSYEDGDYSDVTIYQDGNNITISSDNYIDFEITVPSEFNLSLNTSGGDIELLNNIKGKIKINTSGGDIGLKEVGGELTANTSGGDITCGNINGDVKLSSGGGDVVVGKVEGECKVSTGGGNVSVKNVTKALTVSTGGGNVDCGNIGSDINVVTGGGNISVDNISGAMTVTTGGGNISGTGVSKGGTVTTGAGNVSLNNLSGYVEISSGAGDVMAEFVSIGNKESEILSGYGNITIFIPENAKVTIEATVKSAEGNTWTIDKGEISEIIKSEFKSSTEDKRKGEYHAVYIVNGGGTQIHLQTSIGYIEIKKLKR
jgi:hypothetical protein